MASFLKRTVSCGELRAEHEHNEVTLNGWVDTVRDIGGVIFVVIRDRYGKTQLNIDPVTAEAAAARAKELRNEFCIAAKGKVILRPDGMRNKDMDTGDIEVQVSDLEILSTAPVLPFQLDDYQNVSEDLRLKYRFLDLRREAAQRTFRLRHTLAQTARRHLDERGFLELETPVLTRSTPEGARDFLVPNRREHGTFYALPQSPQLFKQLLMVGGYDKYFQVVRCFRDEDLRADRQPEFTQIDLEMSFIDEEDIFALNEGLMSAFHQAAKGEPLPGPYPRFTYDYCIKTYGSDKPDTRFDCHLVTLSPYLHDTEFKVFRETIDNGGQVIGIRLPGQADAFSRKKTDQLNDLFKTWGGGGLAFLKYDGEKLSGSIAKFFPDEKGEALIQHLSLHAGDIAFFGAGPQPEIYHHMGILRQHLGTELDLIDRSRNAVFWVTDFPLVEWNPDEARWDALHHPFTAPHPEDVEKIATDPGSVRSRAYDLVYNGYELAGGSIRIHSSEVQNRVFGLLGITPEEAEHRFPFLLRGLSFGAPPHGGIAWGFDRLVMVMGGIDNIKDVIPFPKNNRGICPMTDAPTSVDEEQLAELHMRLTEKGSEG